MMSVNDQAWQWRVPSIPRVERRCIYMARRGKPAPTDKPVETDRRPRGSIVDVSVTLGRTPQGSRNLLCLGAAAAPPFVAGGAPIQRR